MGKKDLSLSTGHLQFFAEYKFLCTTYAKAYLESSPTSTMEPFYGRLGSKYTSDIKSTIVK